MTQKLYVILSVILFITFTAKTTYAQDIIVTTKGTKIEARILEIGLETVKYKEFSYQDGPDYVIKKSDIASIIPEKGNVIVFEKESTPVRQPQPQPQMQPQPQPQYKPQQAERKFVKPTYIFENYIGHPIYREHKTYYFKDTTIGMDKMEYLDFLERACPQAYDTYKSGKRRKGGGIAWGCIGGAMITSGVVMILVGYYELQPGDGFETWGYGYYGRNYKDYYRNDHFYNNREYGKGTLITGIILTSIGTAFEFGLCLPLCLTGKRKMNSALDVYNQSCLKEKPTTSLSFDFSGNAFSLNLNFRSK